MFEQQYVLNKIEQWAERLPYRTLRIEVELPGQTLTLEKSKARPIGFNPPPIRSASKGGDARWWYLICGMTAWPGRPQISAGA